MKQATRVKASIPKSERTLVNLTNGKRKPKTAKDKKIIAELNARKKEGGMIYIPHD
jgi:hypothetical protein